MAQPTTNKLTPAEAPNARPRDRLKQQVVDEEGNKNQPFIRRLRVTFGPLEEWRGLARGEIVSFLSDGSMDGLRVTANIHTSIMSIPTPSLISIYNLAEDTRQAISRSLTKISIDAGWRNTNMQQVFQGSLISSWSERSGADIITRLTAIPGYGAMVRGVSSVTFTRGLPLREAILRLGSQLPGVKVNESMLVGIEGTIGKRGFSYSGRTKDALTALAEEYGFSWTIDNGELHCIKDGFMLGDYVELGGENSGIINVVPLTMGPLQFAVGVKIKATYVPGIRAGKTIKINPRLNPKYNGSYRIHICDMSLDPYSEAWTMDIQSYNFGVGQT